MNQKVLRLHLETFWASLQGILYFFGEANLPMAAGKCGYYALTVF